MMYILIILGSFSTNGGGSVATAEFNGKANCEAAAHRVVSVNPRYNAICVERGR